MKITKSCALILMLESGNDEHKKEGFAHFSLVKLTKKQDLWKYFTFSHTTSNE